jgi:DNA-3-methyladenine glycosylase
LTLAAYRAGDSSTEQDTQKLQTLRRLGRDELTGSSVELARRLLGTYIVREDDSGRLIGRIAETEAYDGPRDKASHARAGRTPRTDVMFGPPGHAYVYLVYGMHHCLNVVCGTDGVAAAVLIRALEPVVGVHTMRARRGQSGGPDARLTAGPARSCEALAIDRSFSGLDLATDERLWIASDDADSLAPDGVVRGPRIGVDYAGPDWAARPWRFGIAGSAALSKPFPRAA